MLDNDIGALLDWSVLEPGSSKPSESDRKTVVVEVGGMKCLACVNNIQDNVGVKDGIYNVNVSLEKCEGSFLFSHFINPSLGLCSFFFTPYLFISILKAGLCAGLKKRKKTTKI